MDCPNCQAANPDAAKFCNNCGAKLEARRPIQGERRLVTVLFADVVGSTSMAEQMDPEQVTEIMNGAFEFMNDAVGRYGGTVSRLMGDAILAFFGAPVAHENDPERAISAALDIRDAVGDYAESIQRRYGVDFNLRVGLNTGLVVLATVGDQLRSEQTVMGDTVNVAARLQQVADPGDVLISAETLRLTRHAFETEPHGSIQLKGKSEPVETYAVLRRRSTPGQGRGLEGITSRLVGRSTELQTLRSRLQALHEGQGSLVILVGEAGLGKSRLIAEFRDEVGSQDASGLAWFETRTLSYGQTTPYDPWRSLIRSVIGASERDSAQDVRRRLRERMSDLGSDLDQIPFLEALLAVETDEDVQRIVSLDGDVIRDRLFQAVQDLLRGVSRAQPLVLVFDDLHWSDTVSLDLLDAIAELVETESILLISALRPDREAPSWDFLERAAERYGERHTRISLEPLPSSDAQDLLGNLLHIEELPESIREMILSKSDGNPFFLEEVIRTLIDSGHIVRENGHWRATREIVNVSVPDTLVGVLSARIDRLPHETKCVAQLGATLGRIFSYPVLSALCATAPEPERIDDPLPHLLALTEEELVRERARQPELEYIFKHVLTQEAAYNLLLVRTRRAYHHRAAKVLESYYAGRLDEIAAKLAYHFREGEDWPKAIDYSLRAGRRAEEQFYALREAHEHYESAWQALSQLPEPPGIQEVEILLAGMNVALQFLSEDEVLSRLERVETIARVQGDKASLAKVLHWIAHVHMTSGFLSRAMPALMENYQLAEEVGDLRLNMYPSWMMAFSLLDSDPASAIVKLNEVAMHAREQKNTHIQVHGFGGAAVGASRLGRFDEARYYLQQAENAADRAVHPVTKADFHLLSAIVHLAMGETEKGFEHGRIGIDQALASKAMECAAEGYCIIGMGNLQRRQPGEALETFQELMQYVDGFRGDTRLLNTVDAGMAIARFATGDAETLAEIESVLKNSEALRDEYTTAEISLVLAEAYSDRGDRDRAEAHITRALEYYRRTGMRPMLARALNAQANLYDAWGNPEQARDARAEAEALSLELADRDSATTGAEALAADSTTGSG